MKELSNKQKILLECLEWFINEHGFSPTFYELSVMLNCSLSTVYQRVFLLQEKGYVTQKIGKPRTLRVVKK